MHLTMYKVGFGDCFKFEETTTKAIFNNTGSVESKNSIIHKMLVDCGSKNADLTRVLEMDFSAERSITIFLAVQIMMVFSAVQIMMADS